MLMLKSTFHMERAVLKADLELARSRLCELEASHRRLLDHLGLVEIPVPATPSTAKLLKKGSAEAKKWAEDMAKLRGARMAMKPIVLSSLSQNSACAWRYYQGPFK